MVFNYIYNITYYFNMKSENSILLNIKLNLKQITLESLRTILKNKLVKDINLKLMH